jgi:hypothetical protein
MANSHSPSSRVHEILQRMQENVSHVDSLKTCCGVLAILSRDEVGAGRERGERGEREEVER